MRRLHLISTSLAAVFLLTTCLGALAQTPTMRSDAGIRLVLGITLDETGPGPAQGVRLGSVAPQGLAARLGLQPHDDLLAVGGKPVNQLADLRRELHECEGGPNLSVEDVRGTSTPATASAALPTAPTLPTYLLVEGRGLPGVAELGDTLPQIVARLGPPENLQELGAGQGTWADYPGLGLSVLLSGGATPTCLTLKVGYPFVGQTARGLKTDGTEEEADLLYGQPTTSTLSLEKGIKLCSFGSSGVMVGVDEDRDIVTIVIEAPR